MKNFLSLAGGLAAGALAMYYLDSRSGARRRALARDKATAAAHDAADFARSRGQQVVDRVKGALATSTAADHSGPETDAQLSERIRARLGHVVTHPKAIDVRVEQGDVVLTGQILANELDELLAEVKQIPGVASLHHELEVHAVPDDIPALQGLA